MGRKGAMNIQSDPDDDTGLPYFTEVSDSRMHDLKANNGLIPAGNVLVVDRTCMDFMWFNELDSKAFKHKLPNWAHFMSTFMNVLSPLFLSLIFHRTGLSTVNEFLDSIAHLK